jgi:hypothetical protein
MSAWQQYSRVVRVILNQIAIPAYGAHPATHAAAEAVLGLVDRVTFIATFTQRFFAK